MPERRRANWPLASTSAATSAVTLAAVTFLVRLVLGDEPPDAAIGAVGPAIGAFVGIMLLALVSRSPTGYFSVAQETSRAVRSGSVPNDIDASRWLAVVLQQRRAEVVAGWIAPALLLALGIVGWLWAGDTDPVPYRIVAVLFLAGSVIAPLLIRWELRKMDVVAAELRSRLRD